MSTHKRHRGEATMTSTHVYLWDRQVGIARRVTAPTPEALAAMGPTERSVWESAISGRQISRTALDAARAADTRGAS